MNVSSQLSRAEAREHSHDHEGCASCGDDHSHTPFNLKRTMLGLVLIVNSFLVEWILDRSSAVADISAALGANCVIELGPAAQLPEGAPVTWRGVPWAELSVAV